jgi:hypothetical protein
MIGYQHMQCIDVDGSLRIPPWPRAGRVRQLQRWLPGYIIDVGYVTCAGALPRAYAMNWDS